MELKIVSGEQTGADRAALNWAIDNGIPHGGWCPAGRLAEDGPIEFVTTVLSYLLAIRSGKQSSEDV